MSSNEPLIVVALGGNAISPPHAEGNIPQQFAASRRTAERLADLVEHDRRILITHGNGPQVGNVLRRVELAAHEVYPLPLDTCVADTQAGMGYMIATCLNNELRRRGINKTASTLITTVEVDRDDPAFEHASKPIGRPHPRDQADELRSKYGWEMAETSPGAYRRVVASPLPKRILEIELIRTLTRSGELLIVAGGGGIPVACDSSGELAGVEAVIDKDRTSARIACALDAEVLLIATDIERVALDFGKPAQRFVDRMTAAEARSCVEAGQFAAGSMRPKIEAALDFLEHSTRAGRRVIICDLDHVSAALDGSAGTRIDPA